MFRVRVLDSRVRCFEMKKSRMRGWDEGLRWRSLVLLWKVRDDGLFTYHWILLDVPK